MPLAPLEPGQTLDQRYRLIREIGAGGYGVVYEAEQLTTGQRVAIKLLLIEALLHSDDPEREVARFRREVQVIAQLRHPNIVRLIDSGQLGRGRLYMVLDLVDGVTLSRLLVRDGPLPVEQALRLMTQVLEALAYAHARGVVHRDLKPSNIMVIDPGPRCSAMVLDFGTAGFLEDARGADYQSLTGTQQVVGTPWYMAPEQLGREPLTPGVDVYAWGLVLAEALLGRPALDAMTVAEAIFKQLSPEPVALPEALRHSALGAIMRKVVAKDPAARYATALDVLQALEESGARRLASDLQDVPISRDTIPDSGGGGLRRLDLSGLGGVSHHTLARLERDALERGPGDPGQRVPDTLVDPDSGDAPRVPDTRVDPDSGDAPRAAEAPGDAPPRRAPGADDAPDARAAATSPSGPARPAAAHRRRVLLWSLAPGLAIIAGLLIALALRGDPDTPSNLAKPPNNNGSDDAAGAVDGGLPAGSASQDSADSADDGGAAGPTLGLVDVDGVGAGHDLDPSATDSAGADDADGGSASPGAQPGVGWGPAPGPGCAGDGLAACSAACDAGDMAACAGAAEALGGGRRGAPDAASALALAERACAQDVGAGCRLLGLARLEGRGAAQRFDQARAALTRACEVLRDAPACLALSRSAQLGEAAAREAWRARAVEGLGAVCEGGGGAACASLAALLVAHPALAAPGAPSAASRQARACALGVHEACLALPEADAAGADARRQAAAVAWLEACEAADLSGGCLPLRGLLRRHPELDERVPGARAALDEAARALGEGCLEEARPEACLLLSRFIEVSGARARDGVRVEDLEQRACDLGLGRGCAALARRAEGDATGRDPSTRLRDATLAFERACLLGHALSCEEAAARLERSPDVKRDAARTRALRGRLCDAGLAEACATPP